MPREIQAVYRSTDPKAVAYWDELQRRYAAYNAHGKTVSEQYPGYALIETVGGGDRCLSALRGEGTPGDGWKRGRNGGDWSPDRRVKAGKAHHQQLTAVQLKAGCVPGMPKVVFGDAFMTSPGCCAWDGVVWVVWTKPFEVVEKSPAFDATIWERAKLSAYYAAQEAAEGEQVAA